jgi:hypothetical protein
MNKLLTAAAFLALTVTAAPLAADGPKAEKPAPEPGFTPLFNGKDLHGWHVMNKGRFSVRDGVIFLDGGGGWLRSDKEYQDFELRLEFRFLEKGANSGIFFRAVKEGANYPAKTYQVQTMDHPSLGSIYTSALPAPKEKKDEALLKKVMKPAGEWQAYVIRVRGRRVTVQVNGEPINAAEGLADPAGYLGIQGEGGKLEFRHVRIKEL